MSGRETGYTYSKLVTIRGDARTSGDSNTDFRYNLGNTMQRISRVSIPSVVFRNNSYNVNGTGGGANNTFAVNLGLLNHLEFEIDPGWYSTATLMLAVQEAIQTQLDLLGDGQSVVITQDPLTNLVVVQYTAGTGSAIMTLAQVNFKSGIWELLGFVTPVEVSSTATATYFPSLGGLAEVYLHSNELAPGNMIDKDLSGNPVLKNTLIAIPVTAPFGFLNTFECKVDSLCEITYMTPRMLQEVDFSLRDKNGNVIDLHGGNLIINLKVWFNRY